MICRFLKLRRRPVPKHFEDGNRALTEHQRRGQRLAAYS